MENDMVFGLISVYWNVKVPERGSGESLISLRRKNAGNGNGGKCL